MNLQKSGNLLITICVQKADWKALRLATGLQSCDGSGTTEQVLESLTARRCLTTDYPLFLCYTKTMLNELIISSEPQICYTNEQKARWGRKTNYWSSPYKNIKAYRNDKLAHTLLLFKKQESQYHGNAPTKPCNLVAIFSGCNSPQGKQTEPSLTQAVGEAQTPRRNLMTWIASDMRGPSSNILHLWVTPKQLFAISTGYKSALLCKEMRAFPSAGNKGLMEQELHYATRDYSASWCYSELRE